MGGGGDKLPGQYMGWWGDLGSTPQKGVTTYSLSPNRQRPTAGLGTSAFFNTFRRFRSQVLYVAPPFIIAYAVMDWGNKQNTYYNSKAGRAELGDEEE